MKTGDRWNTLAGGVREPSEQWIQGVMNRVRAEALYGGCMRRRQVREMAGLAAAAAALFAVLGWMALPSGAELAWKARAGGCTTEYLFPVER